MKKSGLPECKGQDYKYLGRFAKEKFLRHGHNGQRIADALGALGQGLLNVGAAAALASGRPKNPKQDEPVYPAQETSGYVPAKIDAPVQHEAGTENLMDFTKLAGPEDKRG